LDEADAILTIGLDPVELLASPWTVQAPVVSLRACASGQEYFSAAHSQVGPLADSVAAILARLGDHPRTGWTAAELAAHRTAMLDALRVPVREPLPAWRLIEVLREELPLQSTVSVDAGAHMFPATAFWRAGGPRRFLISNGLATMGFAVPAAVAAALARPDAPSVALTGDGGFAYGAFELETAVRVGARVIVVVLNDASLSLIRIKHEAKGHDGHRLDFGPIRFDRLAEGLGVVGASAATEGDVRTAVRAALGRAASTVIDVRIGGSEYGPMLRALRG
jgi:acetolactate synthase-1/2/3 large subunit